MDVFPLAIIMILVFATATLSEVRKRDFKRRKNLYNNEAEDIAFSGKQRINLRARARRTTTGTSTPTSFTPSPSTEHMTTISDEPMAYPRTTDRPIITTYPITTTTEPTTYPTTDQPITTYPTTTTTEPGYPTTDQPITTYPTTTTTEPTTYPTTDQPITTYPTTTTTEPRTYPTTGQPITTYPATTAELTTYPTTMTPITTTSPTTTVAPSDQCTKEYSCLNCTAARICAPTFDAQSLYEVKRFTCSSPMPYCNYTTGTCSSIVDPQCSDIPHDGSNFICMRDGYFPDPSFCSVYYHCQNDLATKYICEPPLQYNPYTQDCENNNYFCSDMEQQCQEHYSGIKLTFGEVENYFVYCENNSVITVDRCIGAYKFDFNSQLCVATCPHEGLFPKDDDCANFYQCSPRSHIQTSGYVMTDLTCPEGQGFSESAYRCVDRSMASNCNISYPDLFNK